MSAKGSLYRRNLDENSKQTRLRDMKRHVRAQVSARLEAHEQEANKLFAQIVRTTTKNRRRLCVDAPRHCLLKNSQI